LDLLIAHGKLAGGLLPFRPIPMLKFILQLDQSEVFVSNSIQIPRLSSITREIFTRWS